MCVCVYECRPLLFSPSLRGRSAAGLIRLIGHEYLVKPTTDGKLPSSGVTKHYNSTHGGIKYAMGKGNTATHMLYGRLVNENGTRQFGAHAPGCTDDNRLCVSGMVQCLDSDMHALSVKMRRLVSEIYRPSEIQYTDMPSGDWCDVDGADDGGEPRAKKERSAWSKYNAQLAAQRAMRCKGSE